METRKQVSDIYLPDLATDERGQTVAFNWRQLFSLFFTEKEQYYCVKVQQFLTLADLCKRLMQRQPGTYNMIHENRGSRQEDWQCIAYEIMNARHLSSACAMATSSPLPTTVRNRRNAYPRIRGKRATNFKSKRPCQMRACEETPSARSYPLSIPGSFASGNGA